MAEELGVSRRFDEGRARLDEVIDAGNSGDAGRNEATTRLQVIDTLLFDVLGWQREACTAEERIGAQYIDYSLGQPSTVLLVEAKKEGDYFTVPSGTGALAAALPALCKNNKNLAAAVGQVAEYCNAHGVPLALVTNGHQFVAFRGSRIDGMAPLSGTALVIRSLEELRDNFVVVWNLLSPIGVSERNLERFLTGPVNPPPPPKLSAHLPGYPGFRRRNDLESELQILGELFLQDLVKEEEIADDFLRECYCPSGALSQYALVSRQILRHRYAADAKMQDVGSAQDKGGLSPELLSAVLERGLSRRPTVLLGDVGVGKTSFIQHLIRIDAKEELQGAIVLYVNFGAGPALRSDVDPYVVEQFEHQLLEKYGIDIFEDKFVRGMYHGDILRFRRGVNGRLQESDPKEFERRELDHLVELTTRREAHLRKALDHLVKGRGQRVVVFLDNIDQRDDDFQEKVFLIAQTMAESWPVTAFVSLRPSTFHMSRRSGSLSAYQPRVFTISPPRIDLVLLKRLAFAHRRLVAGELTLGADGVTVGSETLQNYVGVLMHSLEQNRDLVECIDNVSQGNVRGALDLLTTFVGSAHVDTRKIMERLETFGQYRIALHEFLRAIVYGEHLHYAPLASPVSNIFDVSSPDPKEHFLVPLIAAFVQVTAESRGSNGGYVPEDDVHAYCQGYGFEPAQISGAIDSMLERRALDASPVQPVGSDRLLRATPLGAYIVNKLVDTFVYVDAVVVDTPIIDAEARRDIRDAHNLRERTERAQRFLDYLDASWERIAPTPEGWSWAEHSLRVRREIERIPAGT